MKKPTYIVWHTAAHYSPQRGKTYDTTKEDLYQWHVRERGWSDIGYHFLIRWDGTVVECRPINRQGAHVAGLNHKSIGICFSGSGDHEPLTRPQFESGIELTKKLQKDYAIASNNVIGHREIDELIELGLLHNRYRTNKSCPGKFVDMKAVRATLSNKQVYATTCCCVNCPNSCSRK